MSLAKELIYGILRAPLKFIGLAPLLNYTVVEQTGSKGWATLTKPSPIGSAHPKRKISNFDGTSIAKELTKEILRTP